MDAAGFVGHRPGAADAAERLGGGEAGLQPVLVEAGAEPGPGEPGAAAPLQRPQAALGAERGGIENRMVEAALEPDAVGARLDRRVEGDEDFGAGEALQAVHPVGDAGHRRRGGRGGGAEIVPARPDPAAARHQAGVTVQDDAVGAGAEGAEQVALRRVGVGEHGERLVGVAGDEDLVEAADFAGGVAQGDAGGIAGEGDDAAAGMDAAGEGGGQGADIGLRPAGDRAPLGRPSTWSRP